MQSQFEQFNELLPELKKETAQTLATPDLARFAQISKSHATLFQPLLLLRQFLHYVTRGKHDLVKSMLEQNVSLIFARGVVIDCSGREFENISGFEYALWALDKHMWTAMIACIKNNQEHKKVFTLLTAQYQEVHTRGVTYRLCGKTITEHHFNFNILIHELYKQHLLIQAVGDKDWNSINRQWKKGVGCAQKLLPMHIVAEYCSDEQFYPVPKFDTQPQSSHQFFNSANSKYESWYHADSRLSLDFAILKGLCMSGKVCAKGISSNNNAMYAGGVMYDWNAMVELYKVRTKDFIELKSQLELTQNNHHQVSQIGPN